MNVINKVYSFNDILHSTFQEVHLLFDYLFINTENEQILGYLYAKDPTDLINKGFIEFISPCKNRIHKICGTSFIRNAKILKIISYKYEEDLE